MQRAHLTSLIKASAVLAIAAFALGVAHAQTPRDPFQGVRPAPPPAAPEPPRVPAASRERVPPRAEPPGPAPRASPFRGTYAGSFAAQDPCPEGRGSVTVADDGSVTGTMNLLLRVGPTQTREWVRFGGSGSVQPDGTYRFTWIPTDPRVAQMRPTVVGYISGDELRIEGAAADSNVTCNRRVVYRRQP
jgi:hypothetical protein